MSLARIGLCVLVGAAVASVLVLVLALPRTAFALPAAAPDARPSSGRTSALSWVRLTGAEGCIGAPALAAAVETRLGRRVFVPPAEAEISVEGTISYRADLKRYRATFRVADHAGAVLGVRDVEESAPSCAALDDRLVFVLSILVDPDAALASPTPASPPPVETPPSAKPQEPPPPIRADPPSPAPKPSPKPASWRWRAGAEFGAAAGIVPQVGAVLSGWALVAPPHWPGVRLKGSSHFPSTRAVAGAARVEIGLITGSLGLCPVDVSSSPFGATVCLSGVVGLLSARGEGFPESHGYDTVLAGAAIDVVGYVAVTRSLVLTVSPTFVVPLTRARLAYDDGAGVRHTIFQTAPIGGSLTLGFAVGTP